MKYRKHAVIGGLLSGATVIYWRWFLGLKVLTYGDWGFFNHQTQRELLSFPYAWVTTAHGGININASTYPISIMWGLLSNFAAFGISERILFLWPSVILGAISAYILVKHVTKNHIASVIGSIVFNLNTYLITARTSHLTLAVSFALAPLILWMFMRSLESKKWSLSILTGLVSSVASYYEFRVFYIIVWILLAYFFYFNIFIDHISFRKFIKNSLFAITPLVLVGLLNMYWFLGLAKLGSLSNNELFSRGLFGNNYFNIQKALTLFHPFWTGGNPADFIVQPIPVYFWLIPIFACVGLYLNRKNKPVVFFGFVALIGILLTKQVAMPFTGLYQGLYDNLPGFNAFREASKFYFLIALGYSVLIGSLVDWLLRNLTTVIWQRYAKYGLTLLIAGIFLWNTKPLITGKIGTLFVPRHVPNDYIVLKDFILKQPDYFRTYWLPKSSRWSIYTNQHSAISGVDAVTDTWNELLNKTPTKPDSASGQIVIDAIKTPYSQQLFTQSSIKYVLVPLEDKANDDNFFPDYGLGRQEYVQALDKTPWLKRINIGTKEIVVYENTNYSAHISAQTKLYNVTNYDQLSTTYSFLKNVGVKEPNFITGSDKLVGTGNVQSIFSLPKEASSGGKPSLSDEIGSKTGITKLYKNTANRNLLYTATDKIVQVYTQPIKNPELNGTKINFPDVESKQTLADVQIKHQTNLYLLLDSQVIPFTPGKTINLGATGQYKKAGLYSLGANQITNGSFEDNLWQPDVSDCHNYDSRGQIAASQSSDSSDGKKSLQLEATRHIACMSQTFTVTSQSKNVLSFDYKSTNSKQAGYYLQFNDPAKTVTKDQLPINAASWQRFNKELDVPAGATSATITLYAYESDGKTNNIVLYDNVTFKQTKLEQAITIPKTTDEFVAMPVNTSTGTNKFSLDASDIDTANVVDNPSFESGPWSPKVGDCNNHDNNGKISQKINKTDRTDGSQSLQLEATRHAACTSKDINLSIDGDYRFSFDYQSPNSKQASYYLQFNDPAKTVINEQLNIKDTGWQKLTKVIKVPIGATSASLVIYAYESDGHANNIVRYDNFNFSKIPDVANTYFLLTEPKDKLIAPKQLSFTPVNPTQQAVQIAGASKPFLLSYAESFNPGWKLYLRPIKDAKPCNQVAAFSAITDDKTNQSTKTVECQGKPSFGASDGISFLRQAPIFDASHIKLNGYANGWIVDPAYIKAHYGPEYYHQNPDGTLDLNLTIYFKPQSYFYIGLAISGTTLATCLGYLGFVYIRRRRQRPSGSDQPKPESKKSTHYRAVV